MNVSDLEIGQSVYCKTTGEESIIEEATDNMVTISSPIHGLADYFNSYRPSEFFKHFTLVQPTQFEQIKEQVIEDTVECYSLRPYSNSHKHWEVSVKRENLIRILDKLIEEENV